MRFAESKVLLGITALAVALAVGVPTSAQALSVNKCAAGKTKCVIKKVKALLGCHSKAEGKGIAVDPLCVGKAEDKFDGGLDPTKGCFAKLEAKPPCLTTGDTASMEAAIDAFVLDVVQELDPGYPAPVLNKCSAGKKKNTGGKLAGKLGCIAKAFGKAPGTVDPACLLKAETKFSTAWGKLEAKPPCLTTGDAAALEAKVDAFMNDVINALDVGPCGNGVLDAGEDCDPVGAGNSCQNASNTSAAFTCNASTCQCDCPTSVTFEGTPTDPASILDTGWTGISHRAPIISNGQVSVALGPCTGDGTRPCGTCTVNGPIANPNAGAGQLNNQRCSGDSSVICNSAPGGGAGCGGPLGTCEWYFGGPLPLAAGGVTTCVYNVFNGAVVGTANIETGEAANSAQLTSTVYTGIAIDNPCPRCNADPTFNDGVQGGTCAGGTRNGLACDASGDVPGRPDFGKTSLDCPLDAGVKIATLPIDLTNATDPVTMTVTANSPNCQGEVGEKCLCDTCNSLAAEPCQTNADCNDPAGPIGPICGGRRCISGGNAGAACTANSECPGGACGRPGEPAKPSACLDDTNTAGTLDCTDTSPVDGEGECTEGPLGQNCSVASGHAQRGCTMDSECGGGVGSCEAANRACFLTGGFTGKVGTNTLIAVGMEDTPVNDVANPTLGAVFCVGPTGSVSVNNVAGLPGPGRVTIRGTALGLP
jgi:hypothetical protein